MSRAALELKNEIVRAGAGAGKTRRLVEYVIGYAKSFREKQGRWPRIVVTTFTRKATEELRERLLAKAFELEDLALRDYLGSKSQLHISTIHGVLSLFLSRYGHLAELDNGVSVISETEAERLQRKVMRDVLLKHPRREELMEWMNFSAWMNAAGSFYQQILADADWRPHHRNDFLRIFEELRSSALKDWQDVAHDLRNESQKPQVLEFAEALAALVEKLARQPLEQGALQLAEWRELLPRRPTLQGKPPPISVEMKARLDQVMAMMDRLAGPDGDPDQWVKWSDQLQLVDQTLREFVAETLRIKRETGVVELHDLELMTRQILSAQPALGSAFSADWDYWLVDEYQDTSPVQVELLRHLIGSRPSFMVGDPQQSIYLFRGARSEVFRAREEELRRTGGILDEAKVNYRSQPEVLAFVNDLFQRVNSTSFTTMEFHPERTLQLDRAAVHFFVSSAEQEDVNIARHIKRLVRERGARFEEICVLGRRRKDLVEIARRLQANGIPTHVHIAAGFFDRREIQDAMAILKFLLNPHDNENLVKVWRSPYFRIPDEEIFRLCQLPGRESLWFRAMNHTGSEGREMREHLIKTLEKRESLGVLGALERIYLDYGLVDFSHRHDVTGRRESNLWKFLNMLAEEERQPGFSWMDFLSRAHAGPGLEDSEESDAVAATEPNCVNLMTIHGSKGLEFEHVIIPRCGKSKRRARSQAIEWNERTRTWGMAFKDGQEENQRSVLDEQARQWRNEREREEQERLLYVAATRAKSSLAFSWSEEKVADDSWANYFTAWTAKPGEFVYQDRYRVEVVKQELSEMPDIKSEASSPTPRPVFQVGELDSPSEQISVTRFLEERHALGFTGSGRRPDLFAASEGVLFHRILENRHYRPDLNAEQWLKTWAPRDAQKTLQALSFVSECKEPPLEHLIHNGQVEWGFQLKCGAGILEGQIDLWGQINDVIWLVDYKTGSSRFTEKAMDQLDLYAYALRRHGLTAQMIRAVVFPFEKKVELLPASSDAELERRFPRLVSS